MYRLKKLCCVSDNSRGSYVPVTVERKSFFDYIFAKNRENSRYDYVLDFKIRKKTPVKDLTNCLYVANQDVLKFGFVNSFDKWINSQELCNSNTWSAGIYNVNIIEDGKSIFFYRLRNYNKMWNEMNSSSMVYLHKEDEACYRTGENVFLNNIASTLAPISNCFFILKNVSSMNANGLNENITIQQLHNNCENTFSLALQMDSNYSYIIGYMMIVSKMKDKNIEVLYDSDEESKMYKESLIFKSF